MVTMGERGKRSIVGISRGGGGIGVGRGRGSGMVGIVSVKDGRETGLGMIVDRAEND